MQAVQTSGEPTLPTAPSLWRSVGFPSGVSRLFSKPHKHRAGSMKASLCFPVLFLCTRQDVLFLASWTNSALLQRQQQGIWCSCWEDEKTSTKMSKCSVVFFLPQIPFLLILVFLFFFELFSPLQSTLLFSHSRWSNRWCLTVQYLSPKSSVQCNKIYKELNEKFGSFSMLAASLFY